MSDCDKALAATRAWLTQMVIGEGLCPFAAAPFRDDRVRLVCTDATDADAIYRAFLAELDAFLVLDPQRDETSLLVLSAGLADFNDYLDMLEDLQAALEQLRLSGVVQLASFHPDYLFDGCDDDDPANYTNRSPWPIFHLIREDGLAAALESYPNPEAIPGRNMARMRDIGLDALRRRLVALRKMAGKDA